jgi:hypothetical protein
MKKTISGLLAVAAMTATMHLAGCDKKPADMPAGDTLFAGTYRMEAKPLYSDMQAKDPEATALTADGMDITFAQVIAAAYAMTSTTDMGGTSEITFGPDGSIVIVFDDPEEGTVPILPDEAEGVAADAITYALSGDRAVFTLSSETIDNLLDAEEDPQTAAATKEILTKFTQGIFTYSAADNTAKITFKYRLADKELALYLDKGMIVETWRTNKDAMNAIAAFLGEGNPEVAALLTQLAPQMDAMLEGFDKIEAGARMTRK